MRAYTWSGLAFALMASSGCGSEPDVIETVFEDELVEAAGRSALLSVSTTATCEELLTTTFDQLDAVTTVVWSNQVSYPFRATSDALEGAPRGQPVVIEIAVLNEDGRLVGRGCSAATLPVGSPANLTIDMATLPQCEAEPTSLDLTVILETSREMQQADIQFGNTVIDDLKAFVELGGFPQNTRFSLLTHGHSEPTEQVPPTGNLDTIQSALETLRNVYDGDNGHFDAIILASELMRTRAVCGRRPAALVVSAGVDQSPLGTFENAVIGLIATRGDLSDDIYSVGIALSDGARTDLGDLISIDVGEVFGAGTAGGFATALSTARFRFQAIVGP